VYIGTQHPSQLDGCLINSSTSVPGGYQMVVEAPSIPCNMIGSDSLNCQDLLEKQVSFQGWNSLPNPAILAWKAHKVTLVNSLVHGSRKE